MVVATMIIAPLGAVSIAANSFAVTAESLCYMPGYGIGSAATTLVGRSVGAGETKQAKRYGNICTAVSYTHLESRKTLVEEHYAVYRALKARNQQQAVKDICIHIVNQQNAILRSLEQMNKEEQEK